MFAIHTLDEEVASKMYKEYLQMNNKEINEPMEKILKWAKYLTRHFTNLPLTHQLAQDKLLIISLKENESKPQRNMASHSLKWLKLK